MAEHTPGPWSTSWIYGGLRHLNRNVDYDAFWLREEDGNIPNWHRDVELIAAAPDLLEMVKRLRTVFRPESEIVQDIDALLAKAEGK